MKDILISLLFSSTWAWAGWQWGRLNERRKELKKNRKVLNEVDKILKKAQVAQSLQLLTMKDFEEVARANAFIEALQIREMKHTNHVNSKDSSTNRDTEQGLA